MAALLPHLRAGEAVAATGVVELVDGAAVVVVDDDGALVRVGSLGQALPIGGVPGADPAADATGEGAGLNPLTATTLGSVRHRPSRPRACSRWSVLSRPPSVLAHASSGAAWSRSPAADRALVGRLRGLRRRAEGSGRSPNRRPERGLSVG